MPATWGGQLSKLRPFLRLHPIIGVGMVAWDAYQLWQMWQQWQEGGWNNDPIGFGTCAADERYVLGPAIRYLNAKPACSQTLLPGAPDTWAGSRPWRVDYRGRTLAPPFSGTRWIPVESQLFEAPPGAPPDWQPIYTEPGFVPSIIPIEVPYPYPFAPPQIPVTPPLTRPNQEPGYVPEPRPEPSDRPSPSVRPSPGLISPIPSIDYVPGKPPKPALHERRPPKPEKEKEKKKRLKPGTSAAWLQFLGEGVGSYTEADDAVAAIYKGLPWKLRRWKGRDGVWRDRDHTSVRRAQRLYQLLGSLSIETAITELVKQELTDAAFGKVGNALKRRAKELGDEGLWSSSGGFQRGGSLQKKNWDDVYKKLKQDAAAREKTRFYTVREQQPDGSWRYVKKQRPVTQIPWYRQKSQYKKRSGRFGTYYADRPSSRPMLRLD